MRPKVTILAAAAAGAHLALVATGALHVDPFDRRGSIGRAAEWYCAMSGADNEYEFFAPDVAPELFATFDVTEADGRVVHDTLETGASPEGDLRIRNLFSLFRAGNKTLPRAAAASLAGTMFARHPGAVRIVVRLVSCELPSMDGYRRGQRPVLRVEYEAELVPRAEIGREGDR